MVILTQSWSPRLRPIVANPMTPERARFRKRALRFNLGLALLVWIAWAAVGGDAAFHALSANWRVAVTMVFGSLVGGGTSEGGGAIAFPVFTKLLHIPAAIARNFSLAIQTVGMGAASLSILYLRIPIERRALLYAGLPGVAGVALGAYYIAPVFPPALARASFTVMVSSLGVALVLINRSYHESRNEALAIFGAQEKSVLVIAGLIGGGVSALVGSGANTIAFMVMVLLFRISEKIVTPTTVLLMAMVSLAGFAFHLAVLRDFGPMVTSYWLAAVPVVVIGAPLGALICSYMPRRAIVLLLLFLIALEFLSTLLLVPMSRAILFSSAVTLAICAFVNWAMSRATRYRPEKFPAVSSQETVDTPEAIA
jgi:uncharacterized membrane protein YfcA